MWSCTENYDPCFPDQPVVDQYLPMWANQAAFKSKLAFIWAEDSSEATAFSSITYSQLNSSVQTIASNLLSSLQRGDTLVILLSPGLRLIETLFACQHAGLVAVPIIPPDPSKFSPSDRTSAHHHLLRVLSQTTPKAAVADPRYILAVIRSLSASTCDRLAMLLRNIRWLSVDHLEDDKHHHINTYNQFYCGCKPEEPYLIQYTSGATGLPKPVVVTAGAAAHNVRAARKAYDLQPSSVIVSWLPQYHDCGLMFLLLTVVAGGTCILTSPSAFLHRPRLWLELITRFKATCTPVPSFALPLVAKRGGIQHGQLPLVLNSLRNLVLINEPIYASPVEDFVKEFKSVGLNPASISPSYGLAENCTFVSTAWQGSKSPNMPSYKKLLPSARLKIPSSSSSEEEEEEEIKIVVVNGETCEPVEDGVEGEIWISSPSNASGYLHHPSLTREVFYGRLQDRASPCFIRTGDRGVITGEERFLYIVGRASDVISVHVHQNQMQQHSHYLETAAYESSPTHLRGGCIAAFGVASQMSRKKDEMVVIVAELQKRKGQEGDKSSIYRKICGEIRDGVMKEEKVSVGLVVLVEGGSIPKTTSGKLRRWAAKDKLLQGKFPVVWQAAFEECFMSTGGGGAKGGAAPSLRLFSFL